MRVSHSAHGRHRAQAPDPRPTPWAIAAIAAVVVAVVAGVALASGALVVPWPDQAPSGGVADPTRTVTSSSPTPSQTETAATVESSRDVNIDGTAVTVEEVSDLVDGESAQAEPTQVTPLGMRLVNSAVITPDGRANAFDAPITLTASGSLTVRNRYRLTDCPDILPAQWPSPTEFPDSTRTYLRLDGPLHTAFALCPKAASKARQLPQLTGAVVEGAGLAVRLTWQGPDALMVRAVGSASGVAALATDPQCDGSCIATISSGGSELVQLQPVDPCPPATTNEALVLVLDSTGQQPSLVSVRVPELHRAVCR